MPELILKLRERELKRIAINKAEFIIGRDPDNDLFIDNIGISRSHTKVLFRNNNFYAVDNGSSNGTFLNGEQVEEQLLKDGDEIQLGKYKVIFSSAGEVSAFMPTMEASPQGADSDKKKVRNVFGTLQFSSDEIQNLLKNQDGTPQTPAQIVSLSREPETSPESEELAKKNKLIVGLAGAMVILVALLLFVLLRR